MCLKLHPRLKGLVILTGLLCAASLPAQTLNFETTAPVPTWPDVFNFTGSPTDGGNVSDGKNYADGAANDEFTYVASDRPSQGQTFKTGAMAGVVMAIWVRNVGYSNDAPKTYWSFAPGGSFTFRITDPSQVNTGGFAIDTETYTITGAEPNNPGGSNFSTTGTGLWLRFGLSNVITLQPNTTYGFDLTSMGSDFFESWGTSNDVYSGGSAYQGSTAGAVDNTMVQLVGDRAFMIELSPYGPPLYPFVSNQPTNTTVPLGANAVFSPGYGGTPPLTYQWYFNTNTPLACQTNATLTVVNATTNLVGAYSVIVSNSIGSTTSSIARLAVLLPSVTTNITFSTSGGGILDTNGLGTGLTTRLGGTGASIPTDDPNLLLDPADDILTVTSPTYDFNGQVLMASAEAPGFNLSSIGFDGTQDFTVTGFLTNSVAGQDYDEAGVFVGGSNTNFVRGGE